MPLRLISPDGLADAPYAYAAVTPPGGLVFTAGACPLDADGSVVPEGDVPGQTTTALDNLEVALGAAGAGLADVVRTTVYVASQEQRDLVAAWRVVEARFGDHRPPSTLLGVAVLGYTGQLVEIDAIAALPA
jgi:enamine deaminase RidA (YjgF/YER057c/UK114 family)